MAVAASSLISHHRKNAQGGIISHTFDIIILFASPARSRRHRRPTRAARARQGPRTRAG